MNPKWKKIVLSRMARRSREFWGTPEDAKQEENDKIESFRVANQIATLIFDFEKFINFNEKNFLKISKELQQKLINGLIDFQEDPEAYDDLIIRIVEVISRDPIVENILVTWTLSEDGEVNLLFVGDIEDYCTLQNKYYFRVFFSVVNFSLFSEEMKK